MPYRESLALARPTPQSLRPAFSCLDKLGLACLALHPYSVQRSGPHAHSTSEQSRSIPQRTPAHRTYSQPTKLSNCQAKKVKVKVTSTNKRSSTLAKSTVHKQSSLDMASPPRARTFFTPHKRACSR